MRGVETEQPTLLTFVVDGVVLIWIVPFRCFRKTVDSEYWLRHVCPSVCPHGKTRLPLDRFELILMFVYFSKICRNKISLTSDKSNEYCTWKPICIYDHISVNSFRLRNFSHKCCRENQNTRFMFNEFFFLESVVSAISWKLTVEPERPHWQYGAYALHAG